MAHTQSVSQGFTYTDFEVDLTSDITIGPVSSGLGRVGPAGVSLSHRVLATCLVGPGAAYTDQVTRCTVFPLPGRMCIVSRSCEARLGCVSGDAWLSTFASPELQR
jgi:hypothetical protein